MALVCTVSPPRLFPRMGLDVIKSLVVLIFCYLARVSSSPFGPLNAANNMGSRYLQQQATQMGKKTILAASESLVILGKIVFDVIPRCLVTPDYISAAAFSISESDSRCSNPIHKCEF